MQNWTKATAILAGIVLLVVLGLATGGGIMLGVFHYSQQWGYILSDFDAYEADFDTIVQTVQAYASDEGDVERLLLVESESGASALSSGGTRLELDETEQTALERIQAAFSDPDARLDMILVYPGRVSFHTVNGQYALVHMANGEKPAFVNRPSESGACASEKSTTAGFTPSSKSDRLFPIMAEGPRRRPWSLCPF